MFTQRTERKKGILWFVFVSVSVRLCVLVCLCVCVHSCVCVGECVSVAHINTNEQLITSICICMRLPPVPSVSGASVWRNGLSLMVSPRPAGSAMWALF